MRTLRIAIPPATAALIVGLAGLAAPAQDDAKAAPATAKVHDFDSRQALSDFYDKQYAEVDRQRIADLAALAPKLKDDEAEAAYSELFHLAVTRDQYDSAEKAAEAFLASGKGSPQTRALASFVNIIAASNRKQYDQALTDLDAFLKGMAASNKPDAKIDPNLLFAVGEAFLQKLIKAREYDAARKVCRLFVADSMDPQVKEHFASRMKRLAMLGQDAPPIAGTDVDGRKISLADYRGKVVLVDFWATWAPPCVAQMPYYASLQAKYGSKGFQVFGVNVDAAQQQAGKDAGAVSSNVRKFLLGMRVGWPTVMNGRGSQDFAAEYGVTDIPANFLIGKDGKILQVELSDTDLDAAIAKALK